MIYQACITWHASEVGIGTRKFSDLEVFPELFGLPSPLLPPCPRSTPRNTLIFLYLQLFEFLLQLLPHPLDYKPLGCGNSRSVELWTPGTCLGENTYFLDTKEIPHTSFDHLCPCLLPFIVSDLKTQPVSSSCKWWTTSKRNCSSRNRFQHFPKWTSEDVSRGCSPGYYKASGKK